MKIEAGKVYLVGAGPGDIGLTTLRAKQLISDCDVLVYDYLANPLLQQWCRADCELIYVGKAVGRHSIPQSEIEEILITKAKAGKSVVRLKGGDPFVFGRGGEEAQNLVRHNLPFEIVPAVTAALSAGAYAGIPVTHRKLSSGVTFLTGHEDPEKENFTVDFSTYAKTEDTLCIYMGMTKLAEIVERLISGGKAANTPVAVVQWASFNKQRKVIGELSTIVELVEESGLSSPSVIIVGEVVTLSSELDWFADRPLFGKRIVVTRSRADQSKLADLLSSKGAEVIRLPLIQIDYEVDPAAANDIWSELSRYEWIVFTSVHGVDGFFKEFFKKYKDLRCLGPMRIACVGNATARAVEAYNLEVDVIPEVFKAENITEKMIEFGSIEHTQVLVITGNKNESTLVQDLEEKGRALVDTFAVYQTSMSDLSEDLEVKNFREQGADAIVFTSGSTVESFIQQAASLVIDEGGQRPKFCSIGPITSEKLRAKKLPVDMVAKEASVEAVVDILIEKL